MKKIGLLGLAHFMIAAGMHESESKQKSSKFDQLDNTYRKSYTPAKQGQHKFTYPDGFECYALNKKNADKKHNRWKKEAK